MIKTDPRVIDAARALERMAFVLAEPVDVDPEQALAAANHFASVAIVGNGLGFTLVAADDGFLCEVAAGMLGIEPNEVPLAVHGDPTALELANVLGGHAIHESDGDQSRLRVELPVRIDRTVAAALLQQARASGYAGVIATDQGRLLIAGVLRHTVR